MTALLDVKALIALVYGWATCPITENGMVRVLSQPAYPSGQRTPAEVIGVLRALKASHRAVHEFWADDVSLSDESLFLPAYIIGTRQVTDAYLLGLAARRGGRVVSFDRSMPWQAIRDGTGDLVESPA